MTAPRSPERIEYERQYRADNHARILERAREYRTLNRDKVNQSIARTKSKNPKKYLDAIKDWQRRHPEKNAEYNRGYRERHPDRAKEAGQKWRAANPEKVRAGVARWRATPNGKAQNKRRWCLKRGLGGVSTKEIAGRFDLFGDVCAYCARRCSTFHMDHLVAVAIGGKHEAENLVPACQRCNLSKHKKPWRAWFRAQPFYSRKRERFIELVCSCT
jgi:5-methylcytosine-specific restriction endonuclease McrA